jgi:hypothetical protein
MCVLAVLSAAYWWAHGKGEKKGYGICTAEFQPRIDKLQDEKLQAQQAVIAAQQAKAIAEASLAKQLEDQADEYSKRIAVLEAGNAGARRELGRLRDALATARTSLRHLSQPAAAGAGPATDGSPADTGELLSQCAGRLVEVGGSADRLAAQVIGLQAYARLAHKACGS